MGLLHIPMTMVSFAAFPVLIGIGIDYAIQFHNRMNEERIGGKPPVEAAVSTVSNVALPVIIALMVTEAGFLSLLSSPVPMIKDFGRTCIIGLVMCYLSALFVNMIILYLSEMRWPRPKREEGTVESTSMIVSSLEKTANFVVQRWRIVLVLALFLGTAVTLADRNRAEPLLAWLQAVFEVVMKAIDIAMRLAPYGVAALLFTLMARSGLDVLARLGLYVGTVLAGLAIHQFVTYSLMLKFVVRYPPALFFARIREVMVTAFSTSSSNATLPTTLRVAEAGLGTSQPSRS